METTGPRPRRSVIMGMFEMTAVLRMAAVLACVIAIVARDGSANSEELAGAVAATGKPAQASTADNAAAVKEEGRSLFNQTCAHCHGPDASTGQSERNLRRLSARYGDDMPNVFRSTVMNGRPDKGMPVWGEILDEKTIDRIYDYLVTVQEGAQ
jgi:polar amino acid transport system substrate-binding protein